MILFVLISLTCISAADNSTTDEIVAQDNDMITDEILTDVETDDSDFTALNTEIANSTTSTIQLKKDYTFNSTKDMNFTEGILINKTEFTIDGQGHSINADGQARIFWSQADKITLKNINFINGAAEYGGAFAYVGEGNLTVINCNFTNNNAYTEDEDGGAILFENGDTLTITNSRFTNNSAYGDYSDGGAVFFKGNDLIIHQSEFIDNYACTSGSLYASGNTVTITDSRFEKSESQREIGAVATYAENSIIDNCKFINNTAEFSIVDNLKGTLTVNNSYFTDNKAESLSAIRNSQFATTIISNCIFENNYGQENNYVIDNNYGTIYLYNNTINTQTAQIHNYGGEIKTPCTAIVLENKTILVEFGAKTTLTAAIMDDMGNLIEDGYGIYFKINNKTIDSTFNSTTSQFEAEYTLNTPGPVTVDLTSTRINMTVKKGALRTYSFVDLENEINNCQNNTLKLTHDYTYNPEIDSNYTDGIIINKTDLTIDGQGHTINGSGLARIFSVVSDNVTLKNITFANGNANVSGGAIQTKNNMTISDSEFIGNGENCIDIKNNAKVTLNNVSSDVQLVNDTISISILELKDVVYGDNVNIKVQVNSSVITSLNSGKLVVKVNDVEYAVDVKDGIGLLVIPKLDVGTYDVNVRYIDNNMTRAEIPVKFNVTAKAIEINAKTASYVINYAGTYKVGFTNVDDGIKVTFTLNGKKIRTTTIKNGAASIKLTAKILKAAKAGSKNLVIKLDSENYSPVSKTVKININKEKTKITAKKKTFKKSKKTKKYTITLKNSKGKAVKKVKVTMKLKGKTFKAKTNNKGKATFKIKKLNKKVKAKATIKFKGDKYYKKATKKVKITIK